VWLGRRPWKTLLVQERASRNPPAYWAWNVWMVGLGTGESRLGPVACGVAGSDALPITGGPGKWRGGRAAVGAGRSTA
ncbi:MAG: hypothetical protein LC808_43240, partial [Actinobacteria bacterium]|nr:hypothetical protein [Actinomycetota bacterium]